MGLFFRLAALWLVAGADPHPTRAALQKAFEANLQTVVEVRKGPSSKGPAGLGVIASTDGLVITSTSWVKLEQAHVRVLGAITPAKVVAADGTLRVAVVQLPEGEYPAAAARTDDAALRPGAWVVGISRGRGGALKPSVGQVIRAMKRSPYVETDLALGPGGPLFDPRGHLVAICVDGRRALPIGLVRERLLRAP
jgi:hypothetical protein